MIRSSTVQFWRMIRLTVTAALVCVCCASEYDDIPWKPDSFNSGPSYSKPPQCVDIPDDLRLCQNVGYTRMLLPNLLDHETMAEVKQQASSWVPLVHKKCHPSTQILLCSLFAPVCLDRPIYPCRWLCEAVRDSCTPIMEAFGFPWPEMLTCDKFPQGDMCIAMTNTTTEDAKPTGNCYCTSVSRPCLCKHVGECVEFQHIHMLICSISILDADSVILVVVNESHHLYYNVLYLKCLSFRNHNLIF